MEPSLRLAQNSDWITVVIVVSLVLLVIAKSLFQNRFFSYIILPFNNKYLSLYNKKDKLIHGFHVLFTVFQVLNTALFIYLGVELYLGDPAPGGPLAFLLILGFLLLFISLKIVLQLGNGFVFNNTKLISEFIYKKLSYLNYSGAVMLLANTVLTYILPGSKLVFMISAILVLAINALGIIFILKNHQKLITSYFFYFILYLCALEIAPLIIISNYLKA